MAPTTLIVMLNRHLGSRSRQWRLTIPLWESVKQVNTPTAYSGMRALTSPWNTITSTAAAAASTMTPLEKTSRSPRLASWRGRNESRATNEHSLGKSAKAVLAARMRMAKVENCST